MKTRLFSLIFCFALILTFFSTQSLCASTIKLKDWKVHSGIKSTSYENKTLKIESSSNMPLLISPDNLLINSRIFTFLVIEIKTEGNYADGRLFFRHIGDKGFNYANSQEIPAGRGNIFHTYVIDLKNNPNWNGMINQLAWQPAQGIGNIDIKNVELSKGDFSLKVRSIWQQIFKFEKPVPRTINIMYGPKIGRTSINSYLYSLIILISLSLIVFYGLKFKDLNRTLNFVIPKILIICFAFWMLLDARTAVEQIRAASIDHKTFGGKNYEEKQALSTYGHYRDFYYFLKFCSSNIPAGSNYVLTVPEGYYYYGEKSKYYLYPIYLKEEKPEYIILYDPQGQLERKDAMPPGYSEYAKAGQGKYILKRSANL
ncbi:hypothetical protein ACFLZ2_02210 [Candidatus Margulisiibacteriota bacterium]